VTNQSDVRAFARRLMGRKSPEAPILDLATAAEVERYERTSANGPTLKRFRVSLDGKLSCSWNKRAAEIFARRFVRIGWYQCQDEAVVQKAFRTHLRYLCKQYNSQQRPVAADSEADDERMQSLLDERRKMSRNARRRSVSVSACIILTEHLYAANSSSWFAVRRHV